MARGYSGPIALPRIFGNVRLWPVRSPFGVCDALAPLPPCRKWYGAWRQTLASRLLKAAPPVVRPEHGLLLACARVRLDPATADRIKALLTTDLDWAYLLRAAQPHGLMPLLYRHLQAIAPEAVPKTIFDHLRSRSIAVSRRNLFLTGELLNVLDVFAAHGIEAIPFKGPVLASTMYGNLSLREFCDLDILVHKRSIRPARDLLILHGYREQSALPRTREAAYVCSQNTFTLVRDAGRVAVDLHSAVAPRRYALRLDYDHLWERRETAHLAARPVPTLSPQDLLLILCWHGTKHLWERLEWICGVAEWLRRYQTVDWADIAERARIYGIQRVLRLGLRLANDLLDAPVPEREKQRAAADPAVSLLTMQACTDLFREKPGPLHPWGAARFYLKARERPADRIRYCLEGLLTPGPADWEFVPLPDSLAWFYSVLRPFRLLMTYGLPKTPAQSDCGWFPRSPSDLAER